MIDHVRRCLELADDAGPDHGSSGSAKAHRKLVRQRQGVKYDAGRARAIAATILERMGEAGRARMEGLLVVGPDGKSTFNRLKKPAQRATGRGSDQGPGRGA
ncbi:hypothetical protein AB0F17_56060 [Nonomuraea sp. NPDC026600]|uniref:hypothetical protein n=1 Tax=Nonomuraea sp. NPDC026600 TaxID=3155363 RepID=UPI0033C90CA6